MTKCYLVAQITITNPDGFAEYQKHVPKTIADYGGIYLVRGGNTTQLEGEGFTGRSVVLEFPSREVAEAWYHSDAYQSIIPYRTNNSTGNLIFVDGYSPV